MNFWLWMAILLMGATAALLIAGAERNRTPPHINRRFKEALQREGIHVTSLSRFEGRDFKTWLLHQLERFSKSELEQMQRQLVQAGWGTPSTRFYFLVAAWLLPLAAAITTYAYDVLRGETMMHALFHLFFAFALVFLLMRRLLLWKAKERRAAIRKEVIALLHLLRMLFDAGLSLEHILHVVEKQGRDLLPNLAIELGLALRRIEAGHDRGEALAEMAAPLDVPELSDTVAMLKQVTRFGGNIREPLTEYTELAEQRQISELREYVSKLSAKMTIVMILFLFPALMIFVAGPGFMGLTSALKGVGG